MAMSFYEVLGVLPGCTAAELRRAYGKKSLVHHPDKAGDPECFKYLTMIYEVLGDKGKRARYDGGGREHFTDPFMSSATTSRTVPVPPINRTFLRELAMTNEAHSYRWGATTLSECFTEAANDNRKEEPSLFISRD
jgi:DnaJ-class molecular chaperone